jgi:hypothetical protein
MKIEVTVIIYRETKNGHKTQMLGNTVLHLVPALSCDVLVYRQGLY